MTDELREAVRCRIGIMNGGWYLGTLDRVWWTTRHEHAHDFGSWQAAEAYLVEAGLVAPAGQRPIDYQTDWKIEALPPLDDAALAAIKAAGYAVVRENGDEVRG